MYICRKRFLKKDLVNSLEKKAYARSHTQPSVCGFEFRYIYFFCLQFMFSYTTCKMSKYRENTDQKKLPI